MENLKGIGKYQFEQFLGGGMSHVYRARDTVIGRTVAVKILTQEGTADTEAKARFLREAQMAGSLAHENIMSVYDFGEDEGRPFMVMEFLRGEDLRSALKNGRTGDLKYKLKLAIQVARALEYIHQQKIIHRDIKPENIHINSNGIVKLMDFGVAKTDELNLTRPGFTMGTPYYMAPEQVTGRDVTPLSDVYSFGMLLFELLTGNKAIQGESIEQLFYKILNEPVDTVPLRQPGIPEPIRILIERCIAKNPAERPESMRAVLGELEKAIEPERQTAATVQTAVPAARPKWVIPSIIAAVIIVAAAAGFFLIRGDKGTETAHDSDTAKSRLDPVLKTPAGDMVLVEAGSLPSFYMDKTEVTNEAYARFCRERQRPLPPGMPQDRPDYPIVNITIVDAKEFAKWAQKRLPTKEEWETAARGAEKRAYPWGNAHDPSMANVADNKGLAVHELMPASSFAQGASPCGVLQMAGNAWEFVDELITPSAGAIESFSRILSPPPSADEPWYIISGGSYEMPLVKNAASEWSAVPARYRSANIGFRCAKPAI